MTLQLEWSVKPPELSLEIVLPETVVTVGNVNNNFKATAAIIGPLGPALIPWLESDW